MTFEWMVKACSIYEFVAHLKDDLCPARLPCFSPNKIRELCDIVIRDALDGLLNSEDWVCVCRISPRESITKVRNEPQMLNTKMGLTWCVGEKIF